MIRPMQLSKTALLFLFALIHLQTAFAQLLPRRAFFGVRMEAVTDETARVMNLPAVKGVLVSSVVPGSTAEAAGLQRGDVWLTLDGREINSPNEGVAALRQLREGDKFRYKYLRQGETFEKEAILKPFPRESYAGFDLEYGVVKSGDVPLRTLISRPKKSGKLPAVLFVQGVGCYSIDTPLDTNTSPTQLLNYLTRQGFVTMRVDKQGMGDSRGVPCSDLDFDTEGEDYRSALKQLRALEYVDASRVFIIGHSMGGVFAPLLARDAPVRGIIAYGTIGEKFMDYFANSRRTIAQANNMSPTETEEYVRLNCDCYRPYFEKGASFADIIAAHPDCRDILGDLGRTTAFWQQLFRLDIPALWSAYSGKALAAWGKADYISVREEHQHIADLVNRAHPGNGAFLELDGCDHGMHTVASMQLAAQGQASGYNPAVSEAIGKWLKENI
jgi:pimeloyl-ACP methyl ester carboxylesterase